MTGGSWHQPSLFRHDSVDSGVSKGAYAGITGNLSGWHGSSRGHDGMSQRSGGGTGNHRHWNGSFHSRKGCVFQEKPPTDIREEKKEDKVGKLQFVSFKILSIYASKVRVAFPDLNSKYYRRDGPSFSHPQTPYTSRYCQRH